MLKIKPTFFIAISLSLVFSLYTRSDTFLQTILFPILIVIGGIGITIASFQKDTSRKYGFLLIALSLGFLSGVGLQGLMKYRESSGYTGILISKVSEFEGILVKDSVPMAGKEESANSNEGSVLTVDLCSVGSREIGAYVSGRGRAIVFVTGWQKLFTGERVRVKGTLAPATNMPGVHFISQAKADKIESLGFAFFSDRFRAMAINGCMAAIGSIGYPASSLLEALFLGSRENLDGNLYEGFKKTGTLHILALSGFHVGIIFAIINLILTPLITRRKALVAGILIVTFYVFITGSSPSLLRAAIAAIVFGIAKLLDRESEPLNILAVTAAIIIFADPYSVYSLSFALSFCAVAGIIVIGRPLSRFLSPFVPSFIGVPIAFSIGAQVFTFPILIASFGVVYLQGMVLTVIVSPLVTIFLAGGIGYIALFGLFPGFLRDVMQTAFGMLYDIIFSFVRFFTPIPGLMLSWSGYYWVVFILILFLFTVDIKTIIERFAIIRKTRIHP